MPRFCIVVAGYSYDTVSITPVSLIQGVNLRPVVVDPKGLALPFRETCLWDT